MTTNTNMQTVRTGFRRVARVDVHDPDTGAARLVFDELLELVERPRVQASSLSLAEAASIPNTLEALEDDSHAVLFGKGNKLLADLVVDAFLVASLPTRKPFECPATRLARGLGAGVCLRLQRCPNVGAVLAVVGEVLPLKRMSCGISSDLTQPEVNAEGGVNIRIGRQVGCVFFDLNIKVVSVFAPFLERGTGRLLPLQALSLELAQPKRENTTTIQQAQTDELILHIQLEDTAVVINRRRLELAMPRLGVGQSRGDPSNSTNCQISRQAKLLAHVAVAAFMQIVLAMLLVLIAPISHKVAGLGKRFKRRVKTSGRRWRNHQSARKSTDCFHTPKYSESSFTTHSLRFRPAQGGQAARRRSNRYPSPGLSRGSHARSL